LGQVYVYGNGNAVGDAIIEEVTEDVTNAACGVRTADALATMAPDPNPPSSARRRPAYGPFRAMHPDPHQQAALRYSHVWIMAI
jgi:hypothetical protein